MQSSTPSFYETLEVRKDASPRRIRRSYLRLAQEYHPDLNAENANADRQFKKIRQVYEILSDPIRRSAYDRNPSSFHLDETNAWSTSPIVTEPVHRAEGRTPGSDSFQPNWAETRGSVGGWLIMFAVTSLAVAATVGVSLMLLMDTKAGNQLSFVAQSEPTQAEPSDQLIIQREPEEPATTNDPTDEEVDDNESNVRRERLAVETLVAEPEWWNLQVPDPEKEAKDWLSVESWDEAAGVLSEPEWTKLSVPNLQPNIDDETPIAAPEWANIPVPELQPAADQPLPENTLGDSSIPLLPPKWTEIQVPDLSEESSVVRDVQRGPPKLSPKSFASRYPRQNVRAVPPNALPTTTYGPVVPTMRRPIQTRLPQHLRADSLRPDSLRPDSLRPDSLRPDSLRPSIPKYLTRPSFTSRPRSNDILMSETKDDYQRRYIPPVSRYGGQLRDVPREYAVPTESWLDR